MARNQASPVEAVDVPTRVGRCGLEVSAAQALLLQLIQAGNPTEPAEGIRPALALDLLPYTTNVAKLSKQRARYTVSDSINGALPVNPHREHVLRVGLSRL